MSSIMCQAFSMLNSRFTSQVRRSDWSIFKEGGGFVHWKCYLPFVQSLQLFALSLSGSSYSVTSDRNSPAHLEL